MFFFEILKESVKKDQYFPVNIVNMDETGFSTLQKPTNSGQVKPVVRERGQNVAVSCQLVVRMYSLCLYFGEKNLCESLMVGAPPGSVGELSDSGWTNDMIFMKLLEHFASTVKESNDNKHLLIVDGHGSYKTLEARIFCRENGIEMISPTLHIQTPASRSHLFQANESCL